MNVVNAADHTGDSDTPPPEGNRYTFVTDSGAHGLEGGNVRGFTLIPAEVVAGA